MQKTLSNTAKKQQPENSQMVRAARSVELYSGPIPSASELAKYESILPGAANRILAMAEKQSQHRQKMENTMLNASIKSEKRGQIFGFVIFGLTIIAGFTLLMFGRNVEGLVSLLLAIGGIIGLFVYNRIEVRKEMKRKEPIQK